MVFRDQQLTCAECGKTFFFTVTEQRRIAERQGADEIETPTLCQDCRSGKVASPPPRAEQPEAAKPPAERPRERTPRAEPAKPPAERPRERTPRADAVTAKEEGLSIADAFPHQEGGIEVKLIGTVKWFSRAKGYGFITKADGEDLFFHRAELAPSSQGWPEDGQRVEFQIRKTEKGPEAFNVSLLPTD
jgi:CspA family cold shock protein